MILLARTKAAHPLAAIYAAGDVFFSPTREDNYPTVNIESESCGTVDVAFDTGGCPEAIGLKDTCVVRFFEDVSRMIQALMVLGITRGRNQCVLRRTDDARC